MIPLARFLTLLALLAAALSGCAPAASTPPPTLATAQDASATAQPGTEEFGLTKEQLVTHIERVEKVISECMRASGFDYVAVGFDTVRKAMVADKSLPGVSDEQYIAQYGYGISTLYTGHAPQLGDVPTPAQIGLGERNLQIFKGLSATDQVAYSRTLFGENADATFAVTLEAEDFSRTGGCTRAAIEQVFTGDQLRTTYINPLDALIQQDPRMVAALSQFAACVREAGFNYNAPNEIEADIRSRLAAITKSAPIETLPADAQAALTELQGVERAVAAVATDCEAKLVDPVAAQIESELTGAPVK